MVRKQRVPSAAMGALLTRWQLDTGYGLLLSETLLLFQMQRAG